MSMAAGLFLAYLKIGVLAFVVMAAVWALVKFIENSGQSDSGGGDGADAD